ncbi:hypothetical protein GPECTOR_34g752 [Gonium pectorale]|uniref:Uncharacterized protein n=1 Tax=Gonium pectorale TaxID=33097 RepID=A0A150GCT8_GONPE|nr:hypothetical protein GPECTOR_34g752 [Gonium pectorale]|eukprot:KXZ47593.1 hypothetical protein GPECTOR_34g752 [Gonium pectorale]
MPELDPAALVAADTAAAAVAAAVGPGWVDLLPAREALPGLPPRALLHAGPPLPSAPPDASAAGCPADADGASRPCGHMSVAAVTDATAIVAVLFEGWAEDEAAARRLVLEGGVQLLPAQDFRVVTPLACVVSPSTQLQVVRDLAEREPEVGSPTGAVGALHPTAAAAAAFSPLQAGPPPAPRFGTLHDLPSHVAKLRRLYGPLAAALRAALTAAGPIPLLPAAAASLAAGEECHAATTVATATVVERLLPHLERTAQPPPCQRPSPPPPSAAGTRREASGDACRGGLQAHEDAAAAATAAEAAAFLRSAPSLFLNLWMAACKLSLLAAETSVNGTAAPGGGAGAGAGDGPDGGVLRANGTSPARPAGLTLVTALGGNGATVGMQLAGAPGVWWTAPAAPPTPCVIAAPVGGAPPQPPPLAAAAGLDGASAAAAGPAAVIAGAALCGAMGDSMVVDAWGFGAMLRPVLPLAPDAPEAPDAEGHRAEGGLAAEPGRDVGLVEHPGLPAGFVSNAATGAARAFPVRVGASAAALLAGAGLWEQALEGRAGGMQTAAHPGQLAAPAGAGMGGEPGPDAGPSQLAVNLSALDAAGVLGIVGRGVYCVPYGLLAGAVAGVLQRSSGRGGG